MISLWDENKKWINDNNTSECNVDIGTKYTPTFIGQGILKSLEQEWINKAFAKPPIITGLTDDTTWLDNTKSFSNWNLMWKQLGSMLFNNGYSLATAIPNVRQTAITLAFMYKYDLEFEDEGVYINNTYASINYYDLRTNDIKTQNDIYHFTYLNNKPIVRKGNFVYSKDKAGYGFVADKNQKIYVYPTNYLPIVVLPMNEKLLPEVEYYDTMYLINEIDRQSNWNGHNFDLSKNNLSISSTNSQLSYEEIYRDIHNKGAVKNMDVNNNDIVGANVIPTDKNSIILGQANLNFLIDKLREIMLYLRDTTSTGTNKFNSEIMMFNQKALDNLISKINLINGYLTFWFRNVVEYANGLTYTKQNDYSNITCNLQLGRVEKVKITTMENQAKNLQTKNETITQAKPQGNKNDNNN